MEMSNFENLVQEISEMDPVSQDNQEQEVQGEENLELPSVEGDEQVQQKEEGEVVEEQEQAQPQESEVEQMEIEGQEQEVAVEEEPKEKKSKKKKTSKYYGVSAIGKRFRAMYGGKYIGMADLEIDAARMVNDACVNMGVAPKNDVPAGSSKAKISNKKAKNIKKSSKKPVKKTVKRRRRR